MMPTGFFCASGAASIYIYNNSNNSSRFRGDEGLVRNVELTLFAIPVNSRDARTETMIDEYMRFVLRSPLDRHIRPNDGTFREEIPMSKRAQPIIIPGIDLMAEAQKQHRLMATYGRQMPTVDSPLTRRRIRFADLVTALARPPKTVRYWLDTIALTSPAPDGGWTDHSVIDIAVLALVAKLVDYGMSVREAGDHARALVQSRTRLLASYRNTPADTITQAFSDCLVAAWRDGDGWSIAPNWTEEVGIPSGAMAVLVPEVIIRDALDRLEGSRDA